MIMKDPSWERNDVVEKLTEAAALLERSMDMRLIPENGARLAYAIQRRTGQKWCCGSAGRDYSGKTESHMPPVHVLLARMRISRELFLR